MTRKVISELAPVFDARDIRDKQQETSEAVRLISAKGPLPIGGFYDIHGLVSFACKGGVLTQAQLLRVLYNMKTVQNVVTFLKGTDVPAADPADRGAAGGSQEPGRVDRPVHHLGG